MKNKQIPLAAKAIEFQRASPEALAQFDERTKRCTMNCGPHRQDPRSDRERKLLCDECETEVLGGEVTP